MSSKAEALDPLRVVRRNASRAELEHAARALAGDDELGDHGAARLLGLAVDDVRRAIARTSERSTDAA